MKKSREETAQTREHILKTASQEFRRGGIANTGVADVMAAAGLTQGGFYRHFESKDALVKEALDSSIEDLRTWILSSFGRRHGKSALVAAIEDYLSLEHRKSTADGCPFVALGSEIARESRDVRDVATAGLNQVIDDLAQHMDGLTPSAGKKEASVILSTMIGAMTVARLVSDESLCASVLAQARKSLVDRVNQLLPT
ncbi:TetR/AcrR family transcriptional regulator [Silvibacterium acidisoli]|uniref:TetR/AcrR family transcriptional regulator n=1 Tax=Acidobacteriaceae bacterium ZG23-2 TaxID=2883246 RepID=UPI00406BEC57